MPGLHRADGAAQADGGLSKPLTLLLDQPQLMAKLTSTVGGLGSISEAAGDGQASSADPDAKLLDDAWQAAAEAAVLQIAVLLHQQPGGTRTEVASAAAAGLSLRCGLDSGRLREAAQGPRSWD